MGLLGKGLVGLLLGGGNKSRNSMPSYLRNADVTYTGSRTRKNFRCIYCGKIARSENTPSCTFGGPCKNSLYGTHYYEER